MQVAFFPPGITRTLLNFDLLRLRFAGNFCFPFSGFRSSASFRTLLGDHLWNTSERHSPPPRFTFFLSYYTFFPHSVFCEIRFSSVLCAVSDASELISAVFLQFGPSAPESQPTMPLIPEFFISVIPSTSRTVPDFCFCSSPRGLHLG